VATYPEIKGHLKNRLVVSQTWWLHHNLEMCEWLWRCTWLETVESVGVRYVIFVYIDIRSICTKFIYRFSCRIWRTCLTDSEYSDSELFVSKWRSPCLFLGFFFYKTTRRRDKITPKMLFAKNSHSVGSAILINKPHGCLGVLSDEQICSLEDQFPY